MKKNMLTGIIWGIVSSVVITLIISGVFAVLIMGERLGENSTFWLGLGITLVSALVGSFVSTGVYRDKTLFVCSFVVLGYILVMMLIGFIGYGNIDNTGFYNIPMGVLGGLSVCLARAGKGRRRYR